MKILVHDYTGHAFAVQLSREMSKRGHNILHVFFSLFQGPKGVLTRTSSDQANFNIVGLTTRQPFNKHSLIKRRSQEIEYGKEAALQLARFRPDIIISGNSPLEVQSLLQRKCDEIGSKFVFWVQDFHGLAVYRLLGRKLPILGHIAGMYYTSLERSLLKQSEAVVLIAEDFLQVTDRWGIPRSKTHVVPNWAPMEDMPVQPRDNRWAQKHGLIGKLCLMYSGTLGMKHNPELLVRLAARFRNRADVRIVVVSEGSGAERLRERKKELSLDNLLIKDFQPFEQLPNVLASADILIAILESDAGAFSVPSKVLSYLCTGRAILLAVPKANLAARIVTAHEAGLVAEPTDTESFLAAAEELVNCKELRETCATNARQYARNNFNITEIGDTFEDLLTSC